MSTRQAAAITVSFLFLAVALISLLEVKATAYERPQQIVTPQTYGYPPTYR